MGKSFDAMSGEELLEYIVNAVVDKYKKLQKKALVIYTGSDIGFEEGLISLKKLADEGYEFDLLLSRGATKILEIAKIKEATKAKNVWMECYEGTVEEKISQYHTIIVPSMTVHTLAHIVACMSNSTASETIFLALQKGKNVVVAIDGCCPDNVHRSARGFNTPEPLKAKLRENMETLKSYGATLTINKNLAHKVMKVTGVEITTNKSQPQLTEKRDSTATRTFISDKVVSAGHMRTIPNNGEAVISKGSLITQLARDEANRRNISLLIQN